MINKASWELAAFSIIARQMRESKGAGLTKPSRGRAKTQQGFMRDRFPQRPQRLAKVQSTRQIGKEDEVKELVEEENKR